MKGIVGIASVWLPYAMEGPTPVSSLLHSSTLVILGLLCGFWLTLGGVSTFATVIVWCGAGLSFLLQAAVAVGQCDLKRTIAFSTISQIGLCTIVTLCSAPSVGVAYVAVHALFKSSVFMLAGILIHGSLDNQDGRSVSSLQSLAGLSGIHLLVYLTSVGAILGLGAVKEHAILFHGTNALWQSETTTALLVIGSMGTVHYMAQLSLRNLVSAWIAHPVWVSNLAWLLPVVHVASLIGSLDWHPGYGGVALYSVQMVNVFLAGYIILGLIPYGICVATLAMLRFGADAMHSTGILSFAHSLDSGRLLLPVVSAYRGIRIPTQPLVLVALAFLTL